MAAMLYEEGYSDILPPQVGLNNQLEYPQVRFYRKLCFVVLKPGHGSLLAGRLDYVDAVDR